MTHQTSVFKLKLVLLVIELSFLVSDFSPSETVDEDEDPRKG